MDIREYLQKEQKGFYAIFEETLTVERRKQLYDAINDWHKTDAMRSALSQEDAFKIFTQHNKFDGFIQWKGTDVCMDFHCECGHHNHYDGYFAYVIKCRDCGNLYAPSCNVEMIRIEKADGFIESEH